MSRHLSQHELLEHVYGVGSGGAHLRDCAECSTRLDTALRTKARLQADADLSSSVSSALLAAQRRAIYGRLDQAARSYVRWAPALAGAGLLAMGLLLLPHARVRTQHAPVPAARVDLSENEQLFSDLYSMEQSVEPSADAPIHELFEEPAAAGEQ